MNDIHPKLQQIIRSMAKYMEASFQFNASLLKSVIHAFPDLSDLEKKNFEAMIEGLRVSYTLLNKQIEELFLS